MQIEQVPAQDWKTWVGARDGAILLDVREPDEWELGTLPGAIRLRMGEIPAQIHTLDADAPTLVVCRSGSRSHQVAQYLTLSGFDEVANMAGGMKALGMQD